MSIDKIFPLKKKGFSHWDSQETHWDSQETYLKYKYKNSLKNKK